MMEMGLDFPDLPLGMVTDLHLERCKCSFNSSHSYLNNWSYIVVTCI